MEIVWSQIALVRTEKIAEFIALDSPTRASIFIERLIDSVSRLAKFPLSGPVLPENPAFRQVIFESYRVIYRLTSKNVEIVTVISPGMIFDR